MALRTFRHTTDQQKHDEAPEFGKRSNGKKRDRRDMTPTRMYVCIAMQCYMIGLDDIIVTMVCWEAMAHYVRRVEGKKFVELLQRKLLNLTTSPTQLEPAEMQFRSPLGLSAKCVEKVMRRWEELCGFLTRLRSCICSRESCAVLGGPIGQVWPRNEVACLEPA
eukprot:835914-Amphidinium_carterae.1